MTAIQAQMTANPKPSSLWFSRWMVRRWVIYYVVASVGYLANVLTTGRLTPVRFLLLTMTYGAWLGIIHLGRWRGMGNWLGQRPPLWWTMALVCLAGASQFIPPSNSNLSWLPILTTTTACLVIATTRRAFGLIAAGGLWLSSSLAFTLYMHDWDLNSQMTLLVTFISFVGFTVAMRELILAHMALADSNAELAVAHTQLQEYSAQIEDMAAVRERNRIAREIHDTLGHALTLLSVQLETAVQFEARGDPGLHAELLESRRVAKACLTDVRHSVEALRPDDAGSLPELLRRLVEEFAANSREMAIILDVEEATQPLSADVSAALYRCAQEALTNVRKHARATKVLLRLSTSDMPERRVELTVLDNGRGTASANDARSSGFGLLGMRERVALFDGTLRASPEPEHGWRVEVMLPLKQSAEAEVVHVMAHATRDGR